MAKKKTKSRRTAYRVILAIDPGASAGAALFVDGQYKGSRACGGASHKSLVVAISELLEEWRDEGTQDVPKSECVCLIEDGGWDRGVGAKTLDRRRGLCMGAAEVSGFEEVFFIGPSTWQSYIFDGKRPEDTKVASMGWCQKWLSVKPETHDEADAICLGYYGVTFCG